MLAVGHPAGAWISLESRMKMEVLEGLFSLWTKCCLRTDIRMLFGVCPLKMVPLLGRAGDTSLHAARAFEPLKVLPLPQVLLPRFVL